MTSILRVYLKQPVMPNQHKRKFIMNIKYLVPIMIVTLLLASCSSIKSIESPEPKTADGLTYFMPKKDIAITITVDKNSNISKVTIGTTPAYPETSKRYVLKHEGNAFGKNTLDVGVTQSGLLTSTKSTTISNVNDVFKNFAASIGIIKKFGILGAGVPAASVCSKEGSHTFIFKTDVVSDTACGLQVTIAKLSNSSGSVVEHTKIEGDEVSGIYYRQNEPYEVRVAGSGIDSSSIVFSPSRSNTYFLPISKTFFANNDADFGLTDGVPTKYKQETESELVSLFNLPADVIGAYFTAVGKVFDSFKGNDAKEVDALTESLKLELAKRKYDACIKAIEDDNSQKIKDLGC